MEYKDIVLPDYNHCVLGTITSILKYYNVETKHKSSKKIDEILESKKYKNIIFLVFFTYIAVSRLNFNPAFAYINTLFSLMY